eukprot:scaffold21858_cov19-Tisochrysis_lutea.AAC.3
MAQRQRMNNTGGFGVHGQVIRAGAGGHGAHGAASKGTILLKTTCAGAAVQVAQLEWIGKRRLTVAAYKGSLAEAGAGPSRGAGRRGLYGEQVECKLSLVHGDAYSIVGGVQGHLTRGAGKQAWVIQAGVQAGMAYMVSKLVACDFKEHCGAKKIPDGMRGHRSRGTGRHGAHGEQDSGAAPNQHFDTKRSSSSTKSELEVSWGCLLATQLLGRLSATDRSTFKSTELTLTQNSSTISGGSQGNMHSALACHFQWHFDARNHSFFHPFRAWSGQHAQRSGSGGKRSIKLDKLRKIVFIRLCRPWSGQRA